MKAKITVSNRREAALIRQGLKDAPTRALLKIIGALVPFPQRSRIRILEYVEDRLADSESSK